uniref:Uncharacterized protein n=1 Tax=Triticum urartu TaxID=4572 RepID=A0A8R7QR61_TRIUA
MRAHYLRHHDRSRSPLPSRQGLSQQRPPPRPRPATCLRQVRRPRPELRPRASRVLVHRRPRSLLTLLLERYPRFYGQGPPPIHCFLGQCQPCMQESHELLCFAPRIKSTIA